MHTLRMQIYIKLYICLSISNVDFLRLTNVWNSVIECIIDIRNTKGTVRHLKEETGLLRRDSEVQGREEA